jgi:hypothetical protein
MAVGRLWTWAAVGLIGMTDATFAQQAPPIPPVAAAPDPQAQTASRMKAAIALLSAEKDAAENRAIAVQQEADAAQARLDAVTAQLAQEVAKSQALQKQIDALKAAPEPEKKS